MNEEYRETLEQVTRDALRAYFDCWNPDLPYEATNPIRNLDWKAEKQVARVDAVAILRLALADGGYNEFDPDALTRHMAPSVPVRLAREGSVALYVPESEFGKTGINAIAKAMKADECDLIGDEWRLWWD